MSAGCASSSASDHRPLETCWSRARLVSPPRGVGSARSRRKRRAQSAGPGLRTRLVHGLLCAAGNDLRRSRAVQRRQDPHEDSPPHLAVAPPVAARVVDHGTTGTCSAAMRCATPRLGLIAASGQTLVPSGKISTGRPEARLAGVDDDHRRVLQIPAEYRNPEQFRFATIATSGKRIIAAIVSHADW